MTEFIDSHAHLADSAFDADREAVIERARVGGARSIICIGESIEAATRGRDIAARHPRIVFFTAGIHPHDAAAFDAERDRSRLERLLHDGACAVGECGLDYHYDNSPRTVQCEVLDLQLDIGARFGLPLVVHSRDAEDDTISFLQSSARAGVTGVLHCFTGTLALARAALDAGWCISFSGIITFKKWTNDTVLQFIPDDRLLAESDAPYLAPVPYRGKRNEPAWVALTVERLATVRRVSVDYLGSLVVANAHRLFALPSGDSLLQ